MYDVVQVQCPYCFEFVEIDVEPQLEGELVQDCEVCCNPWQLRVQRDEEGGPVVFIERAQ